VPHYADAKTAIVEQIIARATRHRPGPAQAALVAAGQLRSMAGGLVELSQRVVLAEQRDQPFAVGLISQPPRTGRETRHT
jgi:hypothetical protein